MGCDCKLGEVCENLGVRLQPIDWTSHSGKKYRIYLDQERFEGLFTGLKDIPKSEWPSWGCKQRLLSQYLGDMQ